ncbi:adenylate kinase isoenzyme 5 [Diorhabda sublineata]|uniref:adenylate kinase isoenzyme 5 n=1 Tax=Diorhabda sublineata TaxID=1163346 RepID=UPI0024E05E64|nr:adenylate kinase isoenzyme 5 [Diorhabda sublineata]
MGICLDTDKSDGSQTFEEGQDTWAQNSPRTAANIATPPMGKFPMLNGTNVHFEAPKVPVIFVLGGPGSGKVTHCDSLMQEKQGVTHINMTDLLQQYAIGNDMPDFGVLSSKTVTEVLMLEMKMSPKAKTYLISGYPRNMRDVVEYSEKIQTVQGVILISWRQKILERQIDYGAKLGQVVLSLARMELNNFYRNVIPVAEYFDQSNMLISINGERVPAEVYQDFKAAIIRILGMQDNPPLFANGKVAPVPDDVVTSELPRITSTPTAERSQSTPDRPKTRVISVNPSIPNFRSPTKAYPLVLWVIGGPGSNKAVLCQNVSSETGWQHASLGRILRSIADQPDAKKNKEIAKLKECISNGELAPENFVSKQVEKIMNENIGKEGLILDGYPRDMAQIAEFESRYKQKPAVILLDCSKLQLGRGRLDDSVTAFRRRLEIFRQSSLPMLRAMDSIGRLTIVDGDTDALPVQTDFKNVVKEHIEYLKTQSQETVQNGYVSNGNVSNGHAFSNGHLPNQDTQLEDLENEPIETISKSVSNGVHNMTNGHVKTHTNGFVPNGLTEIEGHI